MLLHSTIFLHTSFRVTMHVLLTSLLLHLKNISFFLWQKTCTVKRPFVLNTHTLHFLALKNLFKSFVRIYASRKPGFKFILALIG